MLQERISVVTLKIKRNTNVILVQLSCSGGFMVQVGDGFRGKRVRKGGVSHR